MGVLEVLFLTVFWAWVITALLFLRTTLLPNLPLSQAPDLLGLPSETVSFDASDGVRLEGWKITSSSERPWIILCHGVGSNRADLLDVAAGLHGAGFNLFAFDFRGHGGSAGRVTSFGWLEQRDLEGALAFLGRQPDIPAKSYGIYGISMGGAVALMVAARDERLGAVALDSPHSNLDETLGRHLSLMYPALPRVPFHAFILWNYRLRFGVWPKALSPLESAKQLGSRPLLLVHGENDMRMPIQGAKDLLAVASGPKELWVVRGAGHLEGLGVSPSEYLGRVAGFFRGLG